VTLAGSLPLDAATMSADIAQGRRKPSDLLEDCLARIGRANAELGAFVHIDERGARLAAAAADDRQAAGARLGPLDGVPVAVKDNLWVAGMPAHWGSRMWEEFAPSTDDIPVQRLRAAGAIIVGKTNTPEFALSGRTDSPLHGPARNPWDTSLTPGGSSGGSAAALAAGMVPLSLATDAGGSTRLPASYTGLYGLRPTNGRIARRYGFPPMALDFQAVGVMARTLADLEMLYRCVTGPDERDPLSLRLPPPERRARDGGRLRIGWFSMIQDELVDPEVSAAVEECAGLLEQANCELVRRQAPYETAMVRTVWSTISAAGAARAACMHPDRWRGEASRPIAAAAERGLGLTAVEYVRALDRLAELRGMVADTWGDVDAFLCPSAASPAWPLNEEFPASIGGRPGHPMAQNAFATWVNAIGHPGLNIPVHPHADGRPLGVQVVGRFGGDDVVLEVARRLERVATWTRPPFPSW
jgi:aspartyl-tRNA(Asn)/glutamyl-tRNA(Gln) amidotransferase subunit A